MKKQNFIQFVEHASDLGDRLPDKVIRKYYKYTEPKGKYSFKIARSVFGKTWIRERRRKLKFKKLLKRLLVWFSAVLIVAGVFTLFFVSNSMSEEIRGYKGVGGEFFILFLPFALVWGRDLLNDIIDLFK